MTKFYKITNEDELHYGLQYHDGLVEDILPFNHSGSCQPGGIYFASKDILAFLNYGTWIREVTLPEGEEYYTNPGEPVKYKAHRVILGERKWWGDPAVFQSLLDDGCNPTAGDNYAIREAALAGHTEVVKLLLTIPKVDPSDCNNWAIRHASVNGHTEVVRLLLNDPRVDPSDNDNQAIRYAANNGHTEIVKLLLADKRVDPCDCNNFAIRWVARNGHIEIVKLLKDYYVKNGLTIPKCVL